jgi:GNAT superfamily N-acetyltransferase
MELTPVTPESFDELLALIKCLADYEKLDPPSLEAQHRLRVHCFAPHPKFFAYLVRNGEGIAVAYAITFYTYSSFLAKPTLYLEDVFVLPEYRRLGIGSIVFDFLKKEAIRNDCGRIEWQVLDWNTPAISFYEKIGAVKMNEWFSYRLTEEHFE